MAGTAKRASLILAAAAAVLTAGCDEPETGPVTVSAIGAPPRLANPNLIPLDPPGAFLAEAAAQGLVRFDAASEIEPALAQSWIVSDDGLRYTFRIRRIPWSDGTPVTAEQVAARLRAAVSRASRNPLKPVLAAIEDVEAMTDHVLEIRLRGPRPNLLQLLAQPEMAILADERSTGPYRVAAGEHMIVRLTLPGGEEEDEPAPSGPEIALRGEPAALAVARFAAGEADLVVGGTVGDLTLARRAGLTDERLVHDPVAGLFGLAFAAAEDGPLADPIVRRAISMAIDREALAAAIGVPGLPPRTTLVPALVDELPRPAFPDWAPAPMPMRRELATRVTDRLDEPLRLRVGMPEGAGYRIIFALLRRDWRLAGIEAVRVPAQAPADLRLIDAVAPATLASWYLRHFTCDSGRACDPAADLALEAARVARTPAERQTHLAAADRILTAQTVFVPLASPVRWSLVSPRITGFRPNPFARHPAGTLIVEE